MAKSKFDKEKTADGLPLVAVDMGSHCFKVMAATELDPSDPLGSPIRILATEKSNKFKCVKKGIILNNTEASYMLRESILLLSNKIGQEEPLPTAATLLGGKSMRCTPVRVKRSQGIKTPISRNLLDTMQEECLRKINSAKTEQPVVALDTRPASFILDDTSYMDEPDEGTPAINIEGIYSTFFGTPDLVNKTNGTFERAGKSIEKAFARPSALVEALVGEDEDMTGVCIIDMGAETTTISIYKGGQFLHCRVIPQGGQNITQDIAQLGISEENAEKLKLRFGSAFENNGKAVSTIRVKNEKQEGEPVLIKTDFLSHIIVSRLDEIMQAIFVDLKKYEDQINTIFLTGGASKIADIIPYVQAHTSLNVTYGSHADWLAMDTPEEFYGPEYSAVIGALLLQAKYRRLHPGKKLPGTSIQSKGKGLGTKIGTFLEELFTPASVNQ